MGDKMTTFQIIMVILGALSLFGGIVGLYGYMRSEIAKINVQITNFRHELDNERQASMQSEKFNREDHKEIIRKIDELIQKKC